MRIIDWSSDVCSSDLNLFFKFVSPALLDISLDRTGEMLLGVSLPLILLAFFECFYAFRGRRYQEAPVEGTTAGMSDVVNAAVAEQEGEARNRSEERRVGKECVRTCRSRGSP